MMHRGAIPDEERAGEEVYLFGCGPLLAACFDEICTILGRRPDGLLDSSEGKVGRSFMGYEVRSPEILRGRGRVHVVVTARRHRPMEAQVREIHPGARISFVEYRHAFHKAVRISATRSPPGPVLERQPLHTSFRGCRALVTGASSGIGRVLCSRLAALGFDLVLVARNPEALSETAGACRALGVDVKEICADLGRAAGLAKVCAHPDVSVGRIDILFNNAAIAFPKRDPRRSVLRRQDMLEAYAVNVVAPIALSEHFLKLDAAPRKPRIVFLTSNSSDSMASAYTLTKAALNKYANDSRDLYESAGMPLYLLDPGNVRSGMNPDAPAPVDAVFPGALFPLYCRPATGPGFLDSGEFVGASLIQAIDHLTEKYPGQWAADTLTTQRSGRG